MSTCMKTYTIPQISNSGTRQNANIWKCLKKYNGIQIHTNHHMGTDTDHPGMQQSYSLSLKKKIMPKAMFFKYFIAPGEGLGVMY